MMPSIASWSNCTAPSCSCGWCRWRKCSDRFPRLVRDVSRQLGKNVGLMTPGETAEADKTIVDRLFEPLVHLVRNAVDHGIESPGAAADGRKTRDRNDLDRGIPDRRQVPD